MKISNIDLENNVFLAPMAGVTDISFRGLCERRWVQELFALKWLVQRHCTMGVKILKELIR